MEAAATGCAGGDNNNGTWWVRGWRRASERGGGLRPLKGHEELRGRTRGEGISSEIARSEEGGTQGRNMLVK